MTQESQIFSEDAYIFSKNVNKATSFEEIDVQLSAAKTSKDKLDYLLTVIQVSEKNRFAIVK